MNSRERFSRACQCLPNDRPPVWVMRQAGRHLPEYRKLKETHTFHELVQTPDYAVEVTMQPVRRYDMDAAIMFSDILVIPEAMGQPYSFRDVGGIQMEYRLESKADIDRLDTSRVVDHLDYVAQTIIKLRRELGDDKALIGFGGSPWTLATYMVEGGSSRDYRLAKELFYTDRPLFDALMEKITDALIAYFKMQVECGVDAIQIFDSWGGVLAPRAFKEASAQWMEKIAASVRDDVHVIVFSKGAHLQVDDLLDIQPNVLGVDWTVDLPSYRRALPDDVGIQGNLDPVLLNTTPDLVREETTLLLESMRGLNGHIFNLGHGISPHADPANMMALVETVRNFK